MRGQSRGGGERWRRNYFSFLQLVQQLLTPAVQVVQAGLGAAVRVLRQTCSSINSEVYKCLPSVIKNELTLIWERIWPGCGAGGW